MPKGEPGEGMEKGVLGRGTLSLDGIRRAGLQGRDGKRGSWGRRDTGVKSSPVQELKDHLRAVGL